jgi:hypothetical protein
MEKDEKRFVDILGWVLVLGVVVCLVWLLATPQASARTACTVKVASRDVTRLENRLSEARYVESTTRVFSDRYGGSVGRWVWLARDVGWPKTCIPQLMYIITRESGGNPSAKNPTSTASGLLQFLAFHWNGTGDYGWLFNPFDPRDNLRYGLKLYQKQGWTPWSI